MKTTRARFVLVALVAAAAAGGTAAGSIGLTDALQPLLKAAAAAGKEAGAATINKQAESVGMKPLPQPPENDSGEHQRKQQPAENPHAAVLAWADSFVKDEAGHPPRSAVGLSTPDGEGSSSLWEQLFGKQERDSCGVDDEQLPAERKYLVVLPAGEDFDATKWVVDSSRAMFDLIVIFYGKNPEQFECPVCTAVYSASGPKWRLAWRFTLLPEWEQYVRRYRAIMWPDDDLVMDQCVVNTVFNNLLKYDMLMPSICEAQWSYTPWKLLYQSPSSIVRFTTFIEIMAPTFEMDFFQSFIRPSLYNAYTGWGLDFAWPFLLHYPKDKIGVVDEVCIYHPPSQPLKPGSVYAAEAPYDQKEEEGRRFAEYGYFESEIRARGYWFQAVEVLGVLHKPARREGLVETVAKVLQTRLGLLYPVLLLTQAAVIALGLCALTCLHVRRRRRGAQLGVGAAAGYGLLVNGRSTTV